MMDRRKEILLQAISISFGILCLVAFQGVIEHLLGNSFQLLWYHPISFVLCGFLCTIPYFILDILQLHPILSLILHIFSVYAIVMLLGSIFGWYADGQGAFLLSIGYFMVYIFVWIVTIWMGKKDAKQINEALKEIQDKEV